MKFCGSLVFIHGFLGTSSDWDFFPAQGISTLKLDLFAKTSANRPSSLEFEELTEWIKARAAEMPNPRVLIGYSLGGRIALHSLFNSSHLWSGAVIISSHPGLVYVTERTLRLQSDLNWAMKFEKDQWNDVLKAWNSQNVFQNDKVFPPLREESFYSRKILSETLQSLSLGNQIDYRNHLKLLKLPLLWITGQNDTKFCDFGKEVAKLSSNITHVTIPEAGHRILTDQPHLLRKAIIDYLHLIHK